MVAFVRSLLLILVSSLVSTLLVSADHKADQLIECLDGVSGLDVVLPSDKKAYKNATSVWELKVPQAYPVAVVIPTSAAQIQGAVKCAGAANVRVVPKSGGHNYEGWSVQNGTLSVDLQEMDGVVADKSTGVITAGPVGIDLTDVRAHVLTLSLALRASLVHQGATLGMLYYYAWYDAGMGINAGTCPPVGVSGFMLGGGFGYYSRRAGMACDSVTSFEMVEANGRLLKVSRSQNKDLFWSACGGGGGNFGIVTKWNIKMMPVPKTIQYASVSYADDLDTAAQVAAYFQTWASSADANLGSELHVGPNTSAAKLFFYYAGTGSLRSIIESSKLPTLGGADGPKVSYKNYTWIDAVVAQAGWGLTSPTQLLQRSWPSQQNYRRERSYYVFPDGWSSSLYETLFKQMADMYSAGGNIKFRTSGGKISSKSSSSTAFPWRNALGWVITKAEWDDGAGESEQAATAWLDKAASTIDASGSKKASYVNYIDSSIKDWQQAYYASNYKRLQKIKAAVDPTDMFTYPIQGIVAA